MFILYAIFQLRHNPLKSSRCKHVCVMREYSQVQMTFPELSILKTFSVVQSEVNERSCTRFDHIIGNNSKGSTHVTYITPGKNKVLFNRVINCWQALGYDMMVVCRIRTCKVNKYPKAAS